MKSIDLSNVSINKISAQTGGEGIGAAWKIAIIAAIFFIIIVGLKYLAKEKETAPSEY